ncbi:MAG: hypothetical protein KAX25_04985, partial [Dehalococcoidia bacterium]|nr:hypothetical protein [Dehalococcoidia bacterium]
LALSTARSVPINSPPAITSLKANQNVLCVQDRCRVECLASDEDGDELSYEWSADSGEIEQDGVAAVWTAPAQEGSYGIGVTVCGGNGGETCGSVTVTVKSNNPPAITHLTTRASWLPPAGCCRIECIASDPDGEGLTYNWWVEGGEIYGAGPVVMWAAPEATGPYGIAVAVTDDYGGRDEQSLAIDILSPEPPVIEELSLTFQYPEYVKESLRGYRILKGSFCVCQMECVTADWGKELTYRWACDGGEIAANGPVATWTPPHEKSEVTVTVSVSDIMGNVATRDISFLVFRREDYVVERDTYDQGCACHR